MAIIPGDRRRLMDLMMTGLSMAKIFYSSSSLALLEKPIPTEEVFRIEPERRSGYSQAHWHKIQKERKQRLARNPVTIKMSRQLFVEQQSADQVDAMRYLLEVQQFAGGYWNEPVNVDRKRDWGVG